MALDLHSYKINIDSGKLECRYVVIDDLTNMDKHHYYTKNYNTHRVNQTKPSDFFLKEFSKLKKELKKESICITYDITDNFRYRCRNYSLQLIAKPLPNKLYFKV